MMKKCIHIICLVALTAVGSMPVLRSWSMVFNEVFSVENKVLRQEITRDNTNAVAATNGAIVFAFDAYAEKADHYLTRFEKSELNGADLADAALYTWKEHGILIPVEFALAQMQLESACGTRGKSANTNPYNVGEGDSGTHLRFETSREGIYAWFELIAKDYLADKELDELLQNFVNQRGKRYATSTDYEGKLQRQINYIGRWLEDTSAG